MTAVWRRSRSWRAARALLLVWLGWLLLANVTLNTGPLAGQINRQPERFQLTWSRALSLWPGQAWLWNARATGQTRQLRWHLHADRAGGRIALWPLIWRELRVAEVTAHSVDIELDRVATDLAPRLARPGGWTLRFDAIATDSLRALRIGPVFADGPGQGRFGVYKQLRGGPLAILPSSVRLDGARLRHGDQVWLDALSLEAAFALPEHRRDRAPGLSRLGLADASVRLSGQLPAIAVELDRDGRWQPQRALGPGAVVAAAPGTLTLDLGLQAGELVPGGALHLRLPLAARDAAGAAWSAEGRLHLEIASESVRLVLDLPPPPGVQGHLDADLVLAGRGLPVACAPPPPAQPELGPSCLLDPDLRPTLARLDGTVALDWHFASLRWLQPLLASLPWLSVEGAGSVQADLRLVAGALAAGSHLLIPGVAARIEALDNAFTGQAHARVDIVGGETGVEARAELSFDRFDLRPVGQADQAYVLGRNLRLALAGPASLAAGAALSARMQFERALVPDLRVYNRYLPDAGVRLLGGRGELSGDLHLDRAGEVGHGRLDLDAIGARMQLGDLEIAGRLRVDTRLGQADLTRRSFRLDGSSVRLTEVRAVDAGRSRGRDWSARARLLRGRIDWRQPFLVEADLDASASDVALILGLFGPLREFPGWALRLADAGEAQLVGSVRLDGRALHLAPLHARNDRFDLRARLLLGEGPPHGALLLAWGRLQAGLALAGNERKWHLRQAGEWFESGAARSVP